MCSGLRASCICGHYSVLKYTFRCSSLCNIPAGPVQRVDFQCSSCDARDQEILELNIETSIKMRKIGEQFNEAEAEMIAEQEKAEKWIRSAWLNGEMSKEKSDYRLMEVDVEIAKWRKWLENAKWGEHNAAVDEAEKKVAECERKWVEKTKKIISRPEHRQIDK